MNHKIARLWLMFYQMEGYTSHKWWCFCGELGMPEHWYDDGFGEPEDVEGECNAHLYLGDNFGDNHCTVRCKLPKGHGGIHAEGFTRHWKPVVISWVMDERKFAKFRRNFRRERYED